MGMRMRLLTIGLAVVLSASLMAQSGNVAGAWALKTEAHPSPGFNIGALSGTLTLAQQDGKLTGSWKGQLPEPWTLSGQLKDGKFEARTEEKEVPAVRDDVTTRIPVRWLFKGSVSGDTLTGTMTMEQGTKHSEPQPFKATRRQ